MRAGRGVRAVSIPALVVLYLVVASVVLRSQAGAIEEAGSKAVRSNTVSSGLTVASQAVRCFGVVIDSTGNPVPGATLELYQPPANGWGQAGGLDLKRQLTTDGSGGFDLQVGRTSTLLLARKGGLAPAWKTWTPTRDTETKLVLTEPDTIGGQVVDEAHRPVSNAVVSIAAAYCELRLESGARIINYISGRPARMSFSAHTGADGRFQIEGVPTNTAADLTAFAPDKILPEPERTRRGSDRMQCRAGQRDVKLVLEPAASVEGTVLDQETGQPLADARVTVSSESATRGDAGRDPVRSAANGSFRLSELAAGSYHVHVTFAAGNGNGNTNGAAEWVAEPVTVTVEAGEVLRGVRVPASRGGWLEVAVLNAEDRRAITPARVIVSQSAYQANALTDTNGLVLFRLPPGEYRVSVAYEDGQAERPVATAEPGVTNRIAIELNPLPRITGWVRDASGRAIPGQKLMVFPALRANLRELKTDANGQFEFTWAPQRAGGTESPFTLMARDAAHNLVAAQDLEEGMRQLDLRLQPGLAVAGQVLDGEGQPLANATVQVLLEAGNLGFPIEPKSIRTDESGRFEVSALPPDRRYSVLVSARGYGSFREPFQKESGSINRIELEPLRLKRADRRVAGRVVDAEEQPVANALVRASGEGQPGSSARSDAQGLFSLDQLCEGEVRLYAARQGATGEALAAAGETNVTLKLSAAAAYTFRETSQRPSLKGRPLPALAPLGVATEAVPAGKRVLLCLFDSEQRPSRRLLRLLVEQQSALREKGLVIIGVQAAVAAAEAFQEWLRANPLPFPVGRAAEATDQTRWATKVESLPWLILTDTEQRVIAEGFSLEELDEKLKTSAP